MLPELMTNPFSLYPDAVPKNWPNAATCAYPKMSVGTQTEALQKHQECSGKIRAINISN